MDFSQPTTLSRIEPHGLEALIIEDLRRYPGSAIGDVHNRIGEEINRRRIKRALDGLVMAGTVYYEGGKTKQALLGFRIDIDQKWLNRSRLVDSHGQYGLQLIEIVN